MWNLKFEKSCFFFYRVAPKWYIIVHNHDFLYHLGAILEKKKQTFSNFSFHVEDTEKFIKHHLFVYKKSTTDQIFKDDTFKKGCHALYKFKIEMGIADSHPPYFGNILIFSRCSNDSKIIFWYFQRYKKCQKSLSLSIQLILRSTTYLMTMSARTCDVFSTIYFPVDVEQVHQFYQ